MLSAGGDRKEHDVHSDNGGLTAHGVKGKQRSHPPREQLSPLQFAARTECATSVQSLIMFGR